MREAGEQRWYRVHNALCPKGTGGVFLQLEQRQPARRTGVWFVFLAAVLYSIGGLCIKVIPWSGLAINGGRNLIALLVIGGYLCFTKHRPRFNRWILLGAFAICGTNTFFTMANKMTTAANAIVLQFTAPIFVILLSALFWRKRPALLDIAACAAVLLGVACFFVESLEGGELVGNLLALVSGLSYAGVFLLNDLPDSDPISSVFWGDVMSAMIGLPFLLQERDFGLVPMTSLIVLGAFQVGVAYILLTIGLRTTPPVTASLVSGIEPVLNPILVAVFYQETIGPLSLVGAIIVVGSVIGYNVIKGRRTVAAAHTTDEKERLEHDYL